MDGMTTLIVILGLLVVLIIGGGFVMSLEEEPELYSAYADLSIFKDGKISISYIRTGCLTFEEEPVRRCRADLMFNDRAVGFVNFKEPKQERMN